MTQMFETAQARSNTYYFLGNIYLHGPSIELLPYIRAIPELLQAIDRCNGQLIQNESEYIDQLAADHYDMFGLNVYPYESIFLESEQLLDGLVTNEVRRKYRETDFWGINSSESADHIGLELLFLGELCKASSQSERQEQVDVFYRIQEIQYRFLRGHLLKWLPGFTQAVRQQNNPFYAELADLTLQFVLDHYIDISQHIITTQNTFSLPEQVNPLHDKSTTLKDIARFLLKPVHSGLYLSRKDIIRLAKGMNLPRGFGDRLQMLTNLLSNAASYDQFPGLIDNLQALVTNWQTFYEDINSTSKIAPELKPFLSPWIFRLNQTAMILDAIHTEAAIPSE